MKQGENNSEEQTLASLEFAYGRIIHFSAFSFDKTIANFEDSEHFCVIYLITYNSVIECYIMCFYFRRFKYTARRERSMWVFFKAKLTQD